MTARVQRLAPLVLGGGLLAVSGASVLVRLAPDVPAIAAAFWRMVLSTLVMGAVVLARREGEGWRALHASPRRAAALLGAGALLAAHFALWFASLHRTSVAASVVLVNTAPVQTAVFDWMLTRHAPRLRAACGIALGFAGAVLLALFDSGGHAGHALAGDLLAVGGGTAIALYYLAARAFRRSAALAPFTAAVYGAAALALGAWALATSVPLHGFAPRSYAALAGLALVPQALGHTALNWAIGVMPVASVAAIPLGEPLCAMGLAALVLGEHPALPALAAGAVALLGVALVVTDVARPPQETS